MNHSEDLVYQIALSFVAKIGPVTARNLIAHCGSAKAVFEESSQKLLKIPGIGQSLLKQLKSSHCLDAAEKEIRLATERQVHILSYLDKAYPRRLANIPDSPVVLYYRGAEILNHGRTVSIVGTRSPSREGIKICNELIENLHACNIVVFSGLAYGIDINAHRKCLQIQCPTVGIVAHGLSQIYPAEHRGVAAEMLQHGGLLSEYPFQKKAEREHFPMRNRLIAGISDAVIVIETRKKGGSMITANLANAYNKEVFAVPGRPVDEKSGGCNALIKQHKAQLIENANDIIRLMNWTNVSSQLSFEQDLFYDLSEEEKKVLLLTSKNNPVSFECIEQKSSLQQNLLNAILLELEFKGLIKSLPGNRFIRI